MPGQKSADKPGRNPGFSERLRGSGAIVSRHKSSLPGRLACVMRISADYLNHGVVPRWETLVQLSDMFGVSVDYLLKGCGGTGICAASMNCRPRSRRSFDARRRHHQQTSRWWRSVHASWSWVNKTILSHCKKIATGLQSCELGVYCQYG